MNNGMEYLKGILDTLPDLIFVLDRNGIHIDFHSNFDDDLFVSPDEIRGKSVVDLLPKDVAELTLKNIEKTLREKTLSTFEYTLDFENEVKYFDARMTFLEESKVLVVVRNITEKKLMENDIKGKFNENCNIFEKNYNIFERSMICLIPDQKRQKSF